jgi:hypothetical protein
MDARTADELARFLDRIHIARRAIAIAKLVEFGRQADAVAAELPVHWHTRAADALMDIALANSLIRIHGQDLIDQIIQAGFDAR